MLDKCEEFLGWSSPEGPDAERNAKAAKLLSQSRDHYASAIDDIDKALAKSK